ncbi:hypothetical protein LO762_16615 [Actinocorallia sp. API 0066]|uniref:hypothetical protein n=1 Tax=Actinocorallia sp. API 0066 TaxID=2896846 RepID=UPI001E46A8DF|nr:hypothetical protein [Actinocorallia sp. API 0066]MCD0450802.1 hypothetical protein [Actinocorallia sp. API 0066]
MGGTSARTKPADEEIWPEPAGRGGVGKAVVAVLVVLVLVAAGAAAWFLFRPSDGAAGEETAQGPVPDVYVPQSPGQDAGKVASRDGDIRPFTKGELFDGMKKVTYRKYTFTLKTAEVTEDCAAAVWGELLPQTLARGKCTQVARAGYLSDDGQYAGVFVAVNVVDQRAAQQVLNSLDPALNGGFVRAPEIEGAPDFGSGFTAAYSQAIGHYVIMSWVGRADGEPPAAMNELIDTSLAVQKPEEFAWGRIVLLDPR